MMKASQTVRIREILLPGEILSWKKGKNSTACQSEKFLFPGEEFSGKEENGRRQNISVLGWDFYRKGRILPAIRIKKNI